MQCRIEKYTADLFTKKKKEKMSGKDFKQKTLDLGSKIPKILEYWRNPPKSEITIYIVGEFIIL